MLSPKRVKYRKVHRGRMRGKAQRGNTVTFGEFGLQCVEPCWVTDRQIEAARVAMTRHIKRGGKVWIKVFPDKSVTKKPAETRMGSGKGSPEYWVAVVRPGRIMFEWPGFRRTSLAQPSSGGVQAADEDPVRDSRELGGERVEASRKRNALGSLACGDCANDWKRQAGVVQPPLPTGDGPPQ